MKMRGFGLNVKSLKNPLKLVEFYMIPILVSAIKTADELSAASLTRGLSNPEPRTHFMEVKLNKIDYTLLTVSLIGLGVYVYYFLGGVFFLLKIDNVSFSYDNSKNNCNLADINQNIEKGEVILLCGESGCGKTTLTRMINELFPTFSMEQDREMYIWMVI